MLGLKFPLLSFRNLIKIFMIKIFQGESYSALSPALNSFFSGSWSINPGSFSNSVFQNGKLTLGIFNIYFLPFTISFVLHVIVSFEFLSSTKYSPWSDSAIFDNASEVKLFEVAICLLKVGLT
jgi:hypothetical protein